MDDYEWTQEVLKTCFRHSQPSQHGFMDGLSLHYYTHPEGWEKKGSATDFDETAWYKTLSRTLYMETLIKRHSAIMDQYDPDQKIGLIVDEWGTWFEAMPGTNPGFLYQQNTMRDALVAGINLNIFNKYSKRVRMANIAQLVNVLQSVILTEGPRMVKTPTYHVFHMYQCHQDGVLLESHMDTEQIGLEEEYQVPNLTESVSEDENGKMHLTITNLSLADSYPIDTVITGRSVQKAAGSILVNEMHAMNTFDEPETVKVQEFSDIHITGDGISFVIPPCSVVHIEVE